MHHGRPEAKGEKPTPPKVRASINRFTPAAKSRKLSKRLSRPAARPNTSASISPARRLEEKLAEPVHRLGPVTGIIHGAGNLADKLIEKKSVSDFEIVFSTKIDGLENMLASVPVSQLNFLVLFSSIVGFFGNVGQADYAMANEILNKTAHCIKRKYPDLPR